MLICQTQYKVEHEDADNKAEHLATKLAKCGAMGRAEAQGYLKG